MDGGSDKATREEEAMIFEQIDAGGDRNFSYLIGDEESRLGAVVDPGYETDKLAARVQALGL